MKRFKSIQSVPKNFTGICQILYMDEIIYYENGKIHNENGPAVICKNGTKIWYVNGLRHREDGPAEEYLNGSKGWFYKEGYCGAGNKFTNESWKEKVEQLKREEELQIFL